MKKDFLKIRLQTIHAIHVSKVPLIKFINLSVQLFIQSHQSKFTDIWWKIKLNEQKYLSIVLNCHVSNVKNSMII